ncbi:hypothetical protein H8B02_17800 [Bradyrhizobium sp. Pear77]|uniref:hypothetical protein n=1 Tax=Bradyrhizobium altum TaxID=1571202 RepID=UPI001E5A2D49|nr:hypothetical protein [Bradyrhizobium altum]MCC8955221.1 hypothetical protein [Bradyrhizobium altum]
MSVNLGNPTVTYVRRERAFDFGPTMEKQPIPRASLASEILDLLRCEPGCADVREVSISQVHVVGEETTWHVTVVDYGEAAQSIADHAAHRIQERLSTKYSLLN